MPKLKTYFYNLQFKYHFIEFLLGHDQVLPEGRGR